MENLINELRYKNDTITIITDKNDTIWFNGYQACVILGYSNPRDIIRKLVKKRHIKYLKDILDDYKLYSNAQPKSLYLHEAGLYTLMIRSNKPNAERFLFWITEDVIPSIRKNGYYKANNKMIKEFKEFEKVIKQKDAELKESKLRVLSLENNQKNNHLCTKGKYIYVLKSSLDNYIDEDEPDILKIGKL
jgi:prophage antirepressor-like protein